MVKTIGINFRGVVLRGTDGDHKNTRWARTNTQHDNVI